jgi:hypothetical protein
VLAFAPIIACDARHISSTNQLHLQLPTRRLAALNFSAAYAAVNRSETEMLSINGTAMQRTLRDLNRAAVGCPSMTGSWSRPVAKNYRHFGTELDR